MKKKISTKIFLKKELKLSKKKINELTANLNQCTKIENFLTDLEKKYFETSSEPLWDRLKALNLRKFEEYHSLRWRQTSAEEHENFKIFEATHKTIKIIEQKEVLNQKIDELKNSQEQEIINSKKSDLEKYQEHETTYSISKQKKYQSTLQNIESKLKEKIIFLENFNKEIDFYLNYHHEQINVNDQDNIVAQAILNNDQGRIRYIKNKFPKLYNYWKHRLLEKTKDTNLNEKNPIQAADLFRLDLLGTEVGVHMKQTIALDLKNQKQQETGTLEPIELF